MELGTFPRLISAAKLRTFFDGGCRFGVGMGHFGVNFVSILCQFCANWVITGSDPLMIQGAGNSVFLAGFRWANAGYLSGSRGRHQGVVRELPERYPGDTTAAPAFAFWHNLLNLRFLKKSVQEMQEGKVTFSNSTGFLTLRDIKPAPYTKVV